MTLSEALKKAIQDSGFAHIAIERDTGVQRASIARFLAGTNSLRLDKADALANYFGIEICLPRAKPAGKRNK